VSKQIKNISDIPASNQEVQQTHKDIPKLLKLKERADPQKETDNIVPRDICFASMIWATAR
jgi:hypothetical protein